jgi:endonuclease-3 related protein
MASTLRKPGHRATASELEGYFRALLRHFGPQHWWPARTRLEVILGAILTQNTTWRNAELAIQRLRKRGLLNLYRLRRTSSAELAGLIRPAGFYRQKARTIRAFLDWLAIECHGSIPRLFSLPPKKARSKLLTVRGIGPETVDAILLYAGRHPYFVADAYTRRVMIRHRLIPEGSTYSDTQGFLHHHLPRDHALYNEFHALLVEAGKQFCRREAPRCESCPLLPFLPDNRPYRRA